MDLARIGREDASKRLIVRSAVHGVGGYCGSACPIGL
jgi:hypothetical protein